jgi:two-component system nitrate/nitrite response regulator NarL
LQGTRYKVVASAATAAELSSGTRPRGRQALAVVGIDLQNVGDIDESFRQLRSLLPDCKIVLVGENDKRVDPQRMLALSPDACIFNLSSRDTLLKILELVFLNERVFVFASSANTTAEQDVEFNDPVGRMPSDNPSRLGINGRGLSPRECQVLICLAQGKSNKAIARLHNLSDATVKVHLKAILRKINVHNRTQAALWAIQHGFQNHFPESAVSSAAQPDRARAAKTVR